MKKNRKSQKKPVPKADTQHRSTTSSTTGKTSDLKALPEQPPEELDETNDEPKPFTRKSVLDSRDSDNSILNDPEQDSFLKDMSGGFSAQLACQSGGHSLEKFQRTIDRDPTFRARRDQVEDLLSQNVAAALYKKAMDGNVTAQTQWIKTRPPNHWSEDKNGLPEKFEDMEKLSDDDLIRLAYFLDEALPEELEE